MAASRLAGEKLEGIAVHPKSGRTEFFFDLGARVTVRSVSIEGASEHDDQELWAMHDRTRFVAMFSGGAYDTGSLRRAAEKPLPLVGSDWIVVARARERRKVLGKLPGAAV